MHLAAVFCAGVLGAGAAGAAGEAAAVAEPGWNVLVERHQPIRIQRAFIERTPDASARGAYQTQQGVNPWAQLLLYFGTHLIANRVERDKKTSAEEIIVSTDQSVGAAVAVGDTASLKRYETQEDANRAIQPYAEALAGTSLHELLGAAPPGLRPAGMALRSDAAAAGRPDEVVHLAPRFVFAADQRSISVDMVVGIGALHEAAADKAGRALRIQVHSAADDSFDISEHWLADNAKALRETFAALVFKAVDIGRRRLQGQLAAGTGAQRTFRFRLGAENIYVRGTLAEADCERTLVDTLQGHLLAALSVALRDRDLLPARCHAGR